MTQAKATATWTQADANGFYWWRYDKDAAPEPVEVRDGVFYCLADPDPTSVSVGEFLGPITPELFNERDALLREVAQLREDRRDIAVMLKEAAFTHHVEAEHKSAFATCMNNTCAQACRTWNALTKVLSGHVPTRLRLDGETCQ